MDLGALEMPQISQPRPSVGVPGLLARVCGSNVFWVLEDSRLWCESRIWLVGLAVVIEPQRLRRKAFF